MTRKWRLSPAAEAALDDIGDWTYARFGLAQADAYLDELLVRCAAVAVGDLPTRDAALLGAAGAGLRFIRVRSHIVIFDLREPEVVVIAFLPARADLPTRLARLTGDACDPEETPP
jgi:plasmid stabilization system protein ParE